MAGAAGDDRQPQAAVPETVQDDLRRQAHLIALFERAPIGLALVDREHRYQSINPYLAEMNGQPVEAHLGRRIAEVVPAETQRAGELIDRVFQSGLPIHNVPFVGVAPAKAGEQHQWTSTFFPIPGPDGAIALVGVMVVDISERMAMQAALAESEERFRLFFEQAAVAMAMVDPLSTRITKVNDSFCRLLGYSADDLQAKTFTELTHPEDREADTALFHRMVRGEIPTYLSEKRYLRKDGQPAWVQVTATVLRDKDGNPLRTISIIHDLAARKRTEQALRASEQRLQAILDHTEAVVYMKDTAGRYVLINRQIEALFHLRQDQLLGRRDDDLFPPDVAAALRANDRQVLASGRPIAFEEVIPQDDGQHTYLANKFAIVDPAGVPEAVCGIATDISERKRMETEARQAARDREVLLSIVSHDLKNPLAAILLNADILGRILPAGDDKARRRAESIRQTALRMAQLVHDLLDITRMQAGRLALTPEPLRLRCLINETLEAHETLAATKGLHLGCQVQSDLPEIMADRSRLQQVLANLIGNAVKFTPDHGSIHVKACRQDDHILVAVRDSGPGIAPEQQAHVFSRFWQPQESRHQGSGLGLAIAKGIVAAHGGDIWLESTVGKGTTVYFTLPIGHPPVRQMPAEPAEEWRA